MLTVSSPVPFNAASLILRPLKNTSSVCAIAHCNDHADASRYFVAPFGDNHAGKINHWVN
jgi:hypothetical protein